MDVKVRDAIAENIDVDDLSIRGFFQRFAAFCESRAECIYLVAIKFGDVGDVTLRFEIGKARDLGREAYSQPPMRILPNLDALELGVSFSAATQYAFDLGHLFSDLMFGGSSLPGVPPPQTVRYVRNGDLQPGRRECLLLGSGKADPNGRHWRKAAVSVPTETASLFWVRSTGSGECRLSSNISIREWLARVTSGHTS